MKEDNIVEFKGRDAVSDAPGDLLRKGAPQLLQSAVKTVLVSFLAQFQDKRTLEGALRLFATATIHSTQKIHSVTTPLSDRIHQKPATCDLLSCAAYQ